MYFSRTFKRGIMHVLGWSWCWHRLVGMPSPRMQPRWNLKLPHTPQLSWINTIQAQHHNYIDEKLIANEWYVVESKNKQLGKLENLLPTKVNFYAPPLRLADLLLPNDQRDDTMISSLQPSRPTVWSPIAVLVIEPVLTSSNRILLLDPFPHPWTNSPHDPLLLEYGVRRLHTHLQPQEPRSKLCHRPLYLWVRHRSGKWCWMRRNGTQFSSQIG
jgi:hypothetical protein